MTESKVEKPEVKLESRLNWIDQFRGLIVILFIIADYSYQYTMNESDNLPAFTATFLMHGWDFYSYAITNRSWPDMITIIDIGQQIFIFMVGFVLCLSYYSHIEKKGKSNTYKNLVFRLVGLAIISFIYDGLMWNGLDHVWSLDEWRWQLFEGTFATIFWSSLIAFLVLDLTRNKPDSRLWIGLVIIILHGIAYQIAGVTQPWGLVPRWSNPWELPWNTINHIAIAIIGTCTAEWMVRTPEEIGIKKRLLPMAVLSFTGCYLVNYIQPAFHGDATISLALMAIGTSQFIMFIFYQFEKVKFKIPLLSELGRNLLLNVILLEIFMELLGLLGGEIGLDHAFFVGTLLGRIIGMVWVGILPILLLWAVSWLLDKKHVYFKPETLIPTLILVVIFGSLIIVAELVL